MYELKRLGIQYGLYAPGVTTPVLSEAFVSLINRYGRSSETELMARFRLRTKPLALVGMAPMGLQMLGKRRLPLFPDRISPEGREQIRKMLAWCAERGEM
jgi:hypothetical protein